jgi:hypothetical protein
MKRTSTPFDILNQDQFARMFDSLGGPKVERRNQMPEVKPLNLPGMPVMPTVHKPKR